MTKHLKKPSNSAIILFSFLAIYFLIAILSIAFQIDFMDPTLSHFKNYKRLENWNLPTHAYGDFDNDAIEDAISALDYCAFLSSIDTKKVPKNILCTVNGFPFEPDSKTHRVGTKYADTTAKIKHSYLGTYDNRTWQIYINGPSLLSAQRIVPGKGFEPASISFANITDELLHKTGEMMFYIAIVPNLFFQLIPVLK